MVTSSKSFVVIVALAGHSLEVDSAVGRALAGGMEPVLVTGTDKVTHMRRTLRDAGLAPPELRLMGVRRLPLDGVKARARSVVRRVPRALARRLRRCFLALARRSAGRGSVARTTDAAGALVERLAASGSDRLSKRIVEPAIVKSGAGLSRFLEVRGVLRIVREHLRHGRVIGVACLDGRSLLPGWVVGRRYEFLPVVTNFPVDWDKNLVDQVNTFEGGTQW